MTNWEFFSFVEELHFRRSFQLYGKIDGKMEILARCAICRRPRLANRKQPRMWRCRDADVIGVSLCVHVRTRDLVQ